MEQGFVDSKEMAMRKDEVALAVSKMICEGAPVYEAYQQDQSDDNKKELTQ